ncbi:MAG: DUF4421 domain-containing protein [Cyclobacteriaceae bacterium]|nr:DUF4421 domain-containing protein [Cyclobacteriaceae bacterium]
MIQLTKQIVYLSLICVLFNIQSYSQTDKKYVHRYDTLLIIRVFLSQKYTSLIFRNLQDQSSYRFRPNPKLNLGMGGTFGPLTLNLGYGFGFINPDDTDVKGNTKGFDLQANLYFRKFIIDLIAQSYKGLYSTDKVYRDATGKNYLRPDMEARQFGVNGQYVLNHKRFSYRASLFNSDWQKKSAGSLLVGAEIFGGLQKADSSLIPNRTPLFENHSQSLNFFQLGPNLGYAYTLVIHKRFYLTGSLASSLVYQFNTLKEEAETSKSSGFSSNTFFRAFAGYNGTKWAGGISWIHSNMNIASSTELRTDLKSGKASISAVYRLNTPTSKLKKQLPDALQF